MTAEQRLKILKSDLQLLTSVHDEYLNILLSVAEAAIRGEGIDIRPNDIRCDMAVVHYAAYLFRSRAAENGNTAMPRHLRYELNNLLFGQKVRKGYDI